MVGLRQLRSLPVSPVSLDTIRKFQKQSLPADPCQHLDQLPSPDPGTRDSGIRPCRPSSLGNARWDKMFKSIPRYSYE